MACRPVTLFRLSLLEVAAAVEVELELKVETLEKEDKERLSRLVAVVVELDMAAAVVVGLEQIVMALQLRVAEEQEGKLKP